MRTTISIGTRVRLRPILASEFQAFDSHPSNVKSGGHVPKSNSATDADALYERRSFCLSEGDNLLLGVETLDGLLVGCIGTFDCYPQHGTFKYNVSIMREHQRRGFGSEAILLLLRLYFEELRYHKATVYVYAYSDHCVALHRHLGFTQEGTLRSMVYTQGQYFDQLIFGLTKEEYGTLVNRLENTDTTVSPL